MVFFIGTAFLFAISILSRFAKSSVCLTDKPFLTIRLERETASLQFNNALACPEVRKPVFISFLYFYW